MNRYMIEGIARDLEDGKDVIVVDFEYNHSDTTRKVTDRLTSGERYQASRHLIRMSNGGFLQLVNSNASRLDGRRFDVALVSRVILDSTEGRRVGRVLNLSAIKGKGPGRPSEIIVF